MSGTHAAPPVPSPEGTGGSRRGKRSTGRRYVKPAKGSWQARRQARLPWLLLAPAILVIGGLLLYPLGQMVVMSTYDIDSTEWKITGRADPVGLDNYSTVLGDDALWKVALPNTVLFAVVSVLLTVVVGTLVALVLARMGRLFRNITMTCIMAAWALPAVTGTYVWVYLFNSQNGPLTWMLAAVGLIEDSSSNAFDERLPFFSIALINIVHHGFPFVAVTVLAALLTMPQDVTDAALVDGAGPWQRFWKITFPMLKPVFAVVTILSTIWDFKVFTQIYLMPGGDGAQRDQLNLGTWSYFMQAGGDWGMGATIAVLMTLLMLSITIVYTRTLFKEDEL